MTAHLFSAVSDSQFVFAPQFQKRSSRRSQKKQPPNQNRRLKTSEASEPNRSFMNQDALWTVLLDTVPIGVMVLTDAFQVFYSNEPAKQICDRLDQTQSVPEVIRGLCERLIEEEAFYLDPLIMEYQDGSTVFFRVQARWMSLGEQRFLLVHLEDCYASLQEDLTIEQVKFDLTDREAEVWCLMRQEYSYQQIAGLLKITQNTVKTHVKNIYAKRKGLATSQKVWYSR